MMFLVPSGGFTDEDFGILTTPGMGGVPEGIKSGMRWAADNEAFTKEFRPGVFFPWLEKLEAYKKTCLFVTCPDVVGDAKKTLDLFYKFSCRLSGWAVALVAQDGQENLIFPPSKDWQALFIGGTTVWKMSNGAIDCIHRAQELGKRVHIGRVNYLRRYTHFASLDGSENFTCDGTRVRFERTTAINQWRKYMRYPKQQRLEMK